MDYNLSDGPQEEEDNGVLFTPTRSIGINSQDGTIKYYPGYITDEGLGYTIEHFETEQEYIGTSQGVRLLPAGVPFYRVIHLRSGFPVMNNLIVTDKDEVMELIKAWIPLTNWTQSSTDILDYDLATSLMAILKKNEQEYMKRRQYQQQKEALLKQRGAPFERKER